MISMSFCRSLCTDTWIKAHHPGCSYCKHRVHSATASKPLSRCPWLQQWFQFIGRLLTQHPWSGIWEWKKWSCNPPPSDRILYDIIWTLIYIYNIYIYTIIQFLFRGTQNGFKVGLFWQGRVFENHSFNVIIWYYEELGSWNSTSSFVGSTLVSTSVDLEHSTWKPFWSDATLPWNT